MAIFRNLRLPVRVPSASQPRTYLLQADADMGKKTIQRPFMDGQ